MSNYQKKIQALVDEGKLDKSKQNVATVLHDKWCAQLTAGGACNCDPDIRLGEILMSPDSEWRDEVYLINKKH